MHRKARTNCMHLAFKFLTDVSSFDKDSFSNNPTRVSAPGLLQHMRHCSILYERYPTSLMMQYTASVVLLALVHTLVLTENPSDATFRSGHRRLKPRSFPSGSLTTPILNPASNSTGNHSQIRTSQDFNTTTHDTSLCQSLPLTASLWKKLEINSYLDKYPNGTSLSLEEYASRTGALDFQCGIGKICNPGQLCENVYGRDWYALVAAQNWNNFVNLLYQATGDAFDSTSDALPTMLVDFEKDFNRFPRHFTTWAGLISTWISCFPASLFKAIGPITNSIWLSWGTLSWIGLVMISYQITAIGWLETKVLIREGETRFKRASSISWMLGEAQHAAQEIISNITQGVMKAGVSTDKGLASLNRDGIFLSATPVTDRQTLQEEYGKVLKLKTLVKMWRVQNVFIARGADPCTQAGKNGAFDDPKRLSYCGEDSIMMSIAKAQVSGNGFIPTIYGASKVEGKYGFTTEYLTTSSWECQKKYGVFDFEPQLFRNMTDLRNLSKLEDCIVNLPVCDCTRPDIVNALQQGFSITQACRQIAGLPI
ncbi:hypothetical protein PCASD_18285 [Puccinia coronata f. sp. avenae]|uniref:DUF7872 domain-containing protein n=1 Tax=Puccinia coronata f. sp. avenae TaxID=200324 RepID=A0A2N5SP23_9BASI|nr:hypothetical protein PCASD_18285 [Puccinia coronata f. sp. avenae]